MSAYKRKLNTAKLFMILIDEKAGETKKKNVTKCLDEGANINEQFINDSNNTPLHVAVIKGDIEIVNLLLERGANIDCKNIDNKTALDIARELDSDVGRTIVKLLEGYEMEIQMNINKEPESATTTDILSIIKHDKIDSKVMYSKRVTATGIKGQLYESKLLTLALIRASLNQNFSEFYLGTSLDGIGALDDMCIRYKNNSAEGVIFLQAKHRSDVNKSKVTLQDLWRDEGDFSLQKYYSSFSMIRQKFLASNTDDIFFKGKYEDLKCTFVIYTTAECDFINKALVDVDAIDKTARDLINSGDYSKIFRYDYDENDISELTSMLVIDHMKNLGKIMAYFILKGKHDNWMNDPNIKRYHVILARHVINVSDLTPAGHRVGTFHKEFFNNTDEKFMILKLILYKEFVIAKKPNEKEVKKIIEAIKNNPSEETISKLMQNALMRFDDNETVLIHDDRFKDVTIQRFRLSGRYAMCSAALHIAIHEILGKVTFKLPSTFGNIDLAVASGKKGEKRLAHIAEKIELLFDSTRTEPFIIEPGLIALNGGLGSAVGNLLILNEQRTCLILNTNEETLGKNALNLLGKLKSKIKNIDTVKFNPVEFDFPSLILEGDEIEKRNVRMFFDDLWFYTRQSKEDEIEEHAKDAIQDYCVANKHEYSRTASNACYDAIYFIVHEEVQKWWMTDEKSYYLTDNRDYFESLLKQFSGKSLLNIISSMFVNRMRRYDIKFSKNAVDCLISQFGPEATILITEVRILTGIKLAQCFPNMNNYAFIDLDDVTCLSKNDYNSIIHELKSTGLKTLILLYENLTEAKTKIFLRLIGKVFPKNYILVTNEKSAQTLQLHLTPDTSMTLKDVRNDLKDLDFISQEKVLERTFIFQGVSTQFAKVITHDIKTMIKSKILQMIINNEKICLGKSLSNPYYEDIKHYYVQRSLRRENSVINKSLSNSFTLHSNSQNADLIKINTLEALRDTVIIVGAPGIGKSTFLTHLSLETKQQNPCVWIERINLLDQTKQLYRLQENKIKINQIDALKFVCKAALLRDLIRFSIKPIPLPNFDLEIIKGEVVLKNCDELGNLVLFELEMLIHCYNQGKTILLFDGFDEICPHYRKETLDILNCLVTRCTIDTGCHARQRIWITGRSYNNIKEALEIESSHTYNLEIFNHKEQEDFINKYLNINMDLNEIDFKQLQRIDGFFDFMKQFTDEYSVVNSKKIIKLTSFFLYSLYKTAMKYFYIEINKSLTPENKAFCDKWSSIFNSKSSCHTTFSSSEIIFSKNRIHKPHIDEAIRLIYTPLHTYILLNYFQNQIQNSKTTSDGDIAVEWDLDMNTSSFYEHFIETKLKKIRFEEKNQMDLYNPDIMMTYEKEFQDFMVTHKKLAFYATFKDHLHDILPEEDIEEIGVLIQNMEGGREKTGIVDSILSDGTPKFIHLSFQEYLAAEYISDLLKSHQINPLKLWKFILNKTRNGVLDFFDRKLEFDVDLLNVITNNDVKQLIFDELTHNRDKDILNGNILDLAVDFKLKHIITMLLKAMADVVDYTNLAKFIAFVNKSAFFYFGANLGWDEVLIVVLNCIRRVDSDKLVECDFGVLQIGSYKDFSNREIIRDVKWKISKDRAKDKSKRKASNIRRNSV